MSDIKNNLSFGASQQEHFFTLNQQILESDSIKKENADTNETQYHFVNAWEAPRKVKATLRTVARIFLAIITFGISFVVFAIISAKNKEKNKDWDVSASSNFEDTVARDIARQILFHGETEFSVLTDPDDQSTATTINVNITHNAVEGITKTGDVSYTAMANQLRSHLEDILTEKEDEIKEYLRDPSLEAYEQRCLSLELHINYKENTLDIILNNREMESISVSSFDDIDFEKIKTSINEKLTREVELEDKCRWLVTLKNLCEDDFREFWFDHSNPYLIEGCFTDNWQDGGAYAGRRLVGFTLKKRNIYSTTDCGRISLDEDGKYAGITSSSKELEEVVDAFIAHLEEKAFDSQISPLFADLKADYENIFENSTFSCNGQEVTCNPSINSDGEVESFEFISDDAAVTLSDTEVVSGPYRLAYELMNGAVAHVREIKRNRRECNNSIQSFYSYVGSLEDSEQFDNLDITINGQNIQDVSVVREQNGIYTFTAGDIELHLDGVELSSGHYEEAAIIIAAINSRLTAEESGQIQLRQLMGWLNTRVMDESNPLRVGKEITTYIRNNGELRPISFNFDEIDETGSNICNLVVGDESIPIVRLNAPRRKTYLAVSILRALQNQEEYSQTARNTLGQNAVLMRYIEGMRRNIEDGRIGEVSGSNWKISGRQITGGFEYTFTIGSDENCRGKFVFELDEQNHVEFIELYAEGYSTLHDCMARIEAQYQMRSLDAPSREYLFSTLRKEETFIRVLERKITLHQVKEDNEVDISLITKDSSGKDQLSGKYTASLAGDKVFIVDSKGKEVPEELRSEIAQIVKNNRVECRVTQNSYSQYVVTSDIKKGIDVFYHNIMGALEYKSLSITGNEGSDAGGLSREFFSLMAAKSLDFLPTSDEDLIGNYKLKKYLDSGIKDSTFDRDYERFRRLGRLCQIAYMQSSQMPTGIIFTDLFFDVVRDIHLNDLAESGPDSRQYLGAKFAIAQRILVEKKEYRDTDYTLDVIEYFSGLRTLNQILDNQNLQEVLLVAIVFGEIECIDEEAIEEINVVDEQGRQVRDARGDDVKKYQFKDLDEVKKTLTENEEAKQEIEEYLHYLIESKVGRFLHPVVAVVKGMIEHESQRTSTGGNHGYGYNGYGYNDYGYNDDGYNNRNSDKILSLDKIKERSFPDNLQGKLERSAVIEAINYEPYRTNAYSDKKVEWIKEHIQTCSEDELKDFLQFVTGSRTLLCGSRLKISVQTAVQNSTTNDYPEAHTCFRQICIKDNWMSNQRIRELERNGIIQTLSRARTRQQRIEREETIEAAYKQDYMTVFTACMKNCNEGYSSA